MLLPLPFYIGLRYLKAKKQNQFISFITWLSTLGIVLSVAVLVTVLSIMNGFDQVISHKIFDTAHHVTIQDLRRDHTKKEWPSLRQQLLKNSTVLGVAPFLTKQGLLVQKEQSSPAIIYGILPALEATVSLIADQIIAGQFSLKPECYRIVLGEQLAYQLGVTVGETVTLYLPIINKKLLSASPQTKTFEVVGIFSSGKGLGLDHTLAYVHLCDLQSLCGSTPIISGLRIKLNDLYQAPLVTDHLSETLPDHYMVSDWTNQFGHLMTAIALEKTITLWILLLLVAIASFNLVSSLVMVVTEKRSEVAILLTMGMPLRHILGIFMVQGTFIGTGGTLMGLFVGYCLSLNISTLADLCEQWFHLQLFAGNHFIQTLPSHIKGMDFLRVGSAAIIMSILATIYPAFRATQIVPIETLRDE